MQILFSLLKLLLHVPPGGQSEHEFEMNCRTLDYVHNVICFLFPTDDEGGAYEFKGTADSFVEIPNDGKMDTQNSMTILANVYPTGSGGPILNYKTDGWGVHLWQFESTELFVRFVHRNGVFHKPIASRVLQVRGGFPTLRF